VPVEGIASLDRGGRAARPTAARAGWHDIGLNRLGWWLIAVNVAVLAADMVAFRWLGLSVAWSTSQTMRAAGLGAMCALWLQFYVVPGSSTDRVVAEVVFVAFLVLLFTNIAAPAQYAAIALGAPFGDARLAAADRLLGIDLRALVAWTRAHPAASAGLAIAYDSFALQVLFTILALGLLRDRERLWEFAFHFYFCLIVALGVFAFVPSACAPAFHGLVPTIDTTRAVAQIAGFHSGHLRVVPMDDLEGLISFPSFHAAGALMFAWSFRHRPRLFVPIGLLNIAVIAATFMTGEHYVIDVVASLPLFALSVALYRSWGRSLLHERSRPSLPVPA
jgi:hypothetical protein